ncbi:MAG: ester cyclase [Thermoleophilaceae bacterium]|nr:ester cyclase [Thermoleophilaceae bacterium]
MNKPARAPLEELASAWEAAWMGSGYFSRCCTPDVHYEDPAVNEPLRGLEDLEDAAAALRSAFPDLRVERATPAFGDGRQACIPWRALGNHTGAIGTLPETDKFVVLTGIHYVEIEDDRVRRARGFWDLYDATTQMGLLPQRGSLGETALLMLRGFGLRR